MRILFLLLFFLPTNLFGMKAKEETPEALLKHKIETFLKGELEDMSDRYTALGKVIARDLVDCEDDFVVWETLVPGYIKKCLDLPQDSVELVELFRKKVLALKSQQTLIDLAPKILDPKNNSFRVVFVDIALQMILNEENKAVVLESLESLEIPEANCEGGCGTNCEIL